MESHLFLQAKMFHDGNPIDTDQALRVKGGCHTLTSKSPQASPWCNPMVWSGFLKTNVFHNGHPMGTDSANAVKRKGNTLTFKRPQGSQWGLPME